ncbi:MAG: hypothetical protein ABIQ31_18370 [Ferruginibacter sp.]
MHTNLNYQLAMIDLHKRGYLEDFILFGNNLFWIQEKAFIQARDFSIQECYRFAHPEGNDEDFLVLAVSAVNDTIKGILLNHFSFADKSPYTIISKLRNVTVSQIK